MTTIYFGTKQPFSGWNFLQPFQFEHFQKVDPLEIFAEPRGSPRFWPNLEGAIVWATLLTIQTLFRLPPPVLMTNIDIRLQEIDTPTSQN